MRDEIVVARRLELSNRILILKLIYFGAAIWTDLKGVDKQPFVLKSGSFQHNQYIFDTHILFVVASKEKF